MVEILAAGAAYEVEFSDREGRTSESVGLRPDQVMTLHFEAVNGHAGRFIHGDVRLGNIVQTVAESPVYLDFGFAANRPRVYDVAYALVFMVWATRSGNAPEDFHWGWLASLLAVYQESAGIRLTIQERKALLPMMASVPLYAAALDGYTEDPVGKLLGRRSFIKLSAWLLAHPDVV